VFVVAALVFFALALVDAWDATNGELPSIVRLAAATGLWCAGLIAGAYGWATLLGGQRLDHGAALVLSQLGKYVPGGIWQATGQVGLARTTGVGMQRGAVAFSVLALTQTTAGMTYLVLLALTWHDTTPIVRVLLVVAAIAALALLDRRWMVWLLSRIPRTRSASQELIPAQRAVLVAYCMNLLTLAAAGASYLILLGDLVPVDRPLEVLAAYATAWTVGFLALPIPSGLGIREAVLAGLLHASFPSSVIVAASVYQRLTSIAAEGFMAALAAHHLRLRRSAKTAVVARDANPENDVTSLDDSAARDEADNRGHD
jgi:hypothetical protein